MSKRSQNQHPVELRTGGSNTWATPRQFLARALAALQCPAIGLDLAAERASALADRYFGDSAGEALDALTAEWPAVAGSTRWMNPPYSACCTICPDRQWRAKNLEAGEPGCAARGHRATRITDWMRRAAIEGTKASARTSPVLALVPARVDTDWFHNHVWCKASSVTFVRGRLRFLVPGAEGHLVPYKDPAAFPVMLCLYTGDSKGETTFGRIEAGAADTVPERPGEGSPASVFAPATSTRKARGVRA